MTSVAGAEWLADPALLKLLDLLEKDGEEARVAGGAVRNALMGLDVADIDIATTTLPEETTRRASRAGFHVVPTGVAHGTVTVIAGSRSYEVTTLRADIETDGRHAKVVFGRDWKADAERRDFTMNALYARRDGTVIDLVGGLDDIKAKMIRFIGDPEARIREDYLRILRFFRFFAWYGSGRPDADGLKACARLKEGMDRLSGERVWAELGKLFSAPDPSRALLWMRQASVLTTVLPESEKWGIDAIHGLVATERDLALKPDPLLRLSAIIPPDADRMKKMADRLRLSNDERNRLLSFAHADEPAADWSEAALARRAYREGTTGYRFRLKLKLANARSRAIADATAFAEAGAFGRLLGFLEKWERPLFPLRGEDALSLGLEPGPRVGQALSSVETRWADGNFLADRDRLMEWLAEEARR